MRKIITVLIISFTTMIFVQKASAQKFAVKTNLLEAAIGTFNLGGEMSVAPKWTLELFGKYNPWTFSNNRKWKYWQVQPEARYWFCEKMNGHFLGVHAMGGQFNIGNVDMDFKLLGTDFAKFKNSRYEGYYLGGGLSYGYAWTLGRHWNLEGELGVGYIYFNYDKYRCPKCGEKVGSGDHNYFGPTKAALNLIYVF